VLYYRIFYTNSHPTKWNGVFYWNNVPLFSLNTAYKGDYKSVIKKIFPNKYFEFYFKPILSDYYEVS